MEAMTRFAASSARTPNLSTRISMLGQATTKISTERKSDPKRLSQLFRSELD
jgi:hypothetical protein